MLSSATAGAWATIRRSAPAAWTTALVVGSACLYVLWQLRPDLLLTDTTATGGDMGAQVWGPAYLRDHLLPHGRLSGWAPDWYGGFPWLTFYFPIPNLLVVVLDVVLPYNVAFKLVSVSGVVMLPLSAWAFGRLAGLPRHAASCLAAATLPFLFDRSFAVYGGNISSTLAGEYSYAIGLSVALLFLGVYGRGLATGRHRALAAGLLALTALCHVVTVLFALLGAVVLTAMRLDRRRVVRFVAPVGAVAALLAAFWTVPLLARLPYTTNLGWEKVGFGRVLLPQHGWWVVAAAGLGVAMAIVLRRREGLLLSVLAVVCLAAFVVAPEGRLWNARLLPFWLLCLYLLAGYGVAEVGLRAVRTAAGLLESGESAQRRAVLLVPVAALALALIVVRVDDEGGPSEMAAWVFGGYERMESHPEYRAVVDTMREVGRREGCGQALWEYGEDLDRFGTSYGLMLLPHWTDGCIGSMKGLFDESAASSPYQLLLESELSPRGSRYQRDLPYRDLDVAKGVEHLQLLGVRYYLAYSEEARAQARSNRALRLVASSGPQTVTVANYQWKVTWDVFRVEGSDVVVPLAHEPVVLTGVDKGGRGWLDAAVEWFQDSRRWDVPLAASGSRSWARIRGADRDPPRRPVPPATVRNVRADDDSISFDVDRTGSPVLVKASYFPNWRVQGAEGVWRVTPNHMVVVPMSRHVTLHYGTTPVEVWAWLLTLLGLVGLVVLWRRGCVSYEASTGDRVEINAWRAPLDRELAPVD